MDLSRGWNERSFGGWSAWWGRALAIGAVAACLQAALSPAAALSLYLALVWGLATAFIALFVARLCAWGMGLPFSAALAGAARFMPLVWIIPLVDGLGGGGGAVWWVAPSGVWKHLLLAGYGASGWGAPGLACFSVAVAVGIGVLARRFGARPGRIATLVLLAYFSVWTATLVPAFTAWTRLSTYGATLAAPEQVVRQAFSRVWGKTLWLEERERFWTLPTVSDRNALVLVGGAALWLAILALTAPLLPRSRPGDAAWAERVRRFSTSAPALLFGLLIGIRSFSAPVSWIAWGGQWIFVVLVFVSMVRALDLLARSEADRDQRVLALAMAGLGGWWLGWPVAAAFFAAACFQAWSDEVGNWRVAAVSSAAVGWFLCIGAWSVASGADWSLLPHRLFLGVFCFLLALAVWREAGARFFERATFQGVFSERFGPKWSRPALLGVLLAGLLVLWFAGATAAFGWAVVALGVVAAACLWLFPESGRNIALVSWFSLILAGFVLRGR